MKSWATLTVPSAKPVTVYCSVFELLQVNLTSASSGFFKVTL